MSKKHFKDAAEIVRCEQSPKQRRFLAQAFADFFIRHNPRFDRAKFLQACNLPGY